MFNKLSSNKFLLIALGLIAIIGITIISFNASQTSTTQTSPTPQPTLKNFTTGKMPTPVQDKPVTGQIIVKFKPQYTTAQINEHLKQYNASIVKQISGINQTVVKVPAGQEATITQQLKTDPYVDTAQRDYTTHAFFVPNDPYLNIQYGLNNTGQTIKGQKGTATDDIHAETAWNVTQGNGIKVAILDTGINLNHPDLAGKVVAQKIFLSDPSPGTDTSSVEDQNGHGTHVAGILAANTNNGVGVAGVCPGCQLIIGRILDYTGSGTTSDAVAGITWAADQGAKVINMSLGTTDPSTASLYNQAVAYAMQKGAVVVAAAGNDGTNQLNYPAAATGVISVGATDNNNKKPSYSNYGSYVKITAPGDNILSTGPNHSFNPELEPFGYNTSVPYYYLSGTSMATPYVSGVAALVASTAFGTTPQALTNRLYTTADKIAGTGTDWTYGLVDAAAAVGPAPTVATIPSSAIITPTLFCVGGQGVAPCATIPGGVTVAPPVQGGGLNQSGASISGTETNPSISPSAGENGGISPSPIVSGTPGSGTGNNLVCQNVNVEKAFYNLASTPQTGTKVHIKCGSGGGDRGGHGGGNNPHNGFISKFFQFLLQLLQLLLQLITQCLPSSGTGTPIPSILPLPSTTVSLSPAPSVKAILSASPAPSKGAAIVSPVISQSQTTTASCTNPTQTVQMDPANAQAGITLNGFYLTNDTWNTKTGSQTLHICSPSSWYVTANQGGSNGTAVLSYPNVHKDFTNHPAISSFSSITSSFGNKGPTGGDYEYAYDMWINGEATSGSTEIMIWTDNHGQRPAGSQVGTVTLGGVNYTVWKGGSTISYVMNPTTVTSGTVDILAVYKDIISRGWLTSSAQVYQIDYGVEICNTAGTSENFDITNFTLTTQ